MAVRLSSGWLTLRRAVGAGPTALHFHKFSMMWTVRDNLLRTSDVEKKVLLLGFRGSDRVAFPSSSLVGWGGDGKSHYSGPCGSELGKRVGQLGSRSQV